MSPAIAHWWQARQPAERRTLTLGASALGVLLLAGGVLLPLYDQHQALAARLPALRASVAALDAQAAEAQALRARAGAPAAPVVGPVAGPALLARLQASLDSAGLRANGDGLMLQPDGAVDIRLAHAGFDGFMAWLGGTQRETGLAATTLEADALDSPGMTRIHCVLASAGGH